MAKMNFDEEGLLDEPCLSCRRAYVENIWHEWQCDAKVCSFEAEEKINISDYERMSKPLKPCPFCGREALMKVYNHVPTGYDYTPTCTDKSCAGRLSKRWSDINLAINAWNRRVGDMTRLQVLDAKDAENYPIPKENEFNKYQAAIEKLKECELNPCVEEDRETAELSIEALEYISKATKRQVENQSNRPGLS